MNAISTAPYLAFHGCFTKGESACALAIGIAFLFRVAISSPRKRNFVTLDEAALLIIDGLIITSG
jgi:hypothetical protein